MNILILGNAKTGTTGVFNSIKHALLESGQNDYFRLSEPASNVLRSVRRYAPDRKLLVKAMINKNMLDIQYDQFDRHVLLVRDPRDTIVSQLLYYPLQPYGMRRASPERVSEFLLLLDEKAHDSASHSLKDLFDFAVRNLDRDPKWSWEKYMSRNDAAIEHSARHGFHLLTYEDFVDGRLGDLSEYLGVDVRNERVSADTRTGHVIRSATYGEWRQWFTPTDVEFFKPKMRAYMSRFGYTDDWLLPADQRINRDTASGYIARKREKVAQTFAERFVDDEQWVPEDVGTEAQLRRMVEAAEDGGGGSAYRLAQLYEAGGIVKADPQQSFQYAQQAAAVGHTRAMVLLGRYHAHGHGTVQDHAAAGFWYEEAFDLMWRRSRSAVRTSQSLETELAQALARTTSLEAEAEKLRRNVRHLRAGPGEASSSRLGHAVDRVRGALPAPHVARRQVRVLVGGMRLRIRRLLTQLGE